MSTSVIKQIQAGNIVAVNGKHTFNVVTNSNSVNPKSLLIFGYQSAVLVSWANYNDNLIKTDIGGNSTENSYITVSGRQITFSVSNRLYTVILPADFGTYLEIVS